MDKYEDGIRVKAISTVNDSGYLGEQRVLRMRCLGKSGEIKGHKTGHGLCYRIAFDDGVYAWFDHEELELVPMVIAAIPDLLLIKGGNTDTPVILITNEGKFFYKGEEVEKAADVVEAFRQWFKDTGYIK